MTLVIIPVRMESSRLPGKFLERIGNRSVIQHCVARANEAGLAPWVATDSQEIADHIGHLCGVSMTGPANCGTDRVAIAAELIDPAGRHKFVVNYQGDMPFINPASLKAFVEFTEGMEISGSDVATAVCHQNIVEAVPPDFMRTTIPLHIGLYGYSRKALRKFASLPQSALELKHSLEQLRDPYQFRWAVYQFPMMPIEINKKVELEEIRRCRT